MEVRQIKEFLKIEGDFRAPSITEDGKRLTWDNGLELFVYEDDVHVVSGQRETGTDRLELTLSNGQKVYVAFGALAWEDTVDFPVTSVFGRTGDIIAQYGDYDASQVVNCFDVTVNTLDDILPGTTNVHFTVTYRANVDLNTAARHTHPNKAVLDLITSAGSGQIITDYERSLLHSRHDNDAEFVRDTVADFIQDGKGLSWTHDDPGNTLTGDVSLAPFTTDELAEGTFNLYYTDARTRKALSVVLTRLGLSNLTYNDETGVFSYTPVGCAQVRSCISVQYPLHYDPICGVISWIGPSDPCDELVGACCSADVTQVDHGFTFGDAIRLDAGTELWVKAQADSSVHAGCLGIVTDVPNSYSFTYQFGGIVEINPTPWSLGVPYFLSTTVAGGLEVEPTYELGQVRQYIGTGVEQGLLLEIDLGEVIGGSEIPEYPTGTVMSVSAGDGMDFSTITLTGDVTMGTPSSISWDSVNGLTAHSHTHAVEDSGVVAGTYTNATITVNAKGFVEFAEEGTPSTSFDLFTDDSVEGDGTVGAPVRLVNDEPTPAALHYYGTDGSGVKGWHPNTSGGSVVEVIAGQGMDFTTIETSGIVTLGTPGTLSWDSVNGLTTHSHTHAFEDSGVVAGTYNSVTVNEKGFVTAGTVEECGCTEIAMCDVVSPSGIVNGNLYNAYAVDGGETGGDTTIEYGALYNWYAATDVRNIANTGWHVPTKSEMETLVAYIGGTTIAGGKLKETGTTYWDSPNTNAVNDVGYNGRGAGYRISGTFSSIRRNLYCMTTTTYPPVNNYFLSCVYNVENTILSFVTRDTGISIRLVKDSTTLTHGQTGTYTGNDGKIYPTICIGTQEWLATNLWETKYRNNDDIVVEENSVTWSSLTSGAMCYYNNDINNAGSVTPTFSPITSSDDWDVPTQTDLNTLVSSLGSSSVAGGKLKEFGFLHWDTPNTGADNTSGMTVRGSGKRGTDGVYAGIKTQTSLWSATDVDASNRYAMRLTNDSAATVIESQGKKQGNPVRLVNNATILSDGQTGTYTGNDGKTYTTICIGTQEWLAENLAETKYRNLASITYVDAGALNDGVWAAKTTEAYTVYNGTAGNSEGGESLCDIITSIQIALERPLSFLELTDTPDTYSGQATKFLKVKSDETGVEFVTVTPSGLQIGDWIEDIAFEFADITAGTAQTYTLDIKASYGYTIEAACLETDNGTLTGVAIKIGSTAVTSLSSLTVDTAVDETASTGAKTVVAGDRVYLTTSTGYTGTPTLIRGKLKTVRT